MLISRERKPVSLKLCKAGSVSFTLINIDDDLLLLFVENIGFVLKQTMV
jgi:hypothetical protein